MAEPTVANIDSAISASSGMLTKPTLPGYQPDDIQLWICASASETVPVPTLTSGGASGYAAGPNSGLTLGSPAAADAIGLYWFWKRLVASEPDIRVGMSGNHWAGFRVLLRGVPNSGNPYDVAPTGSTATSAAVSVPGGTTTQVDDLVLNVIGTALETLIGQLEESAAIAGSNLTNIAVRFNKGTGSGNGSTLALVTGSKVTAGAYGPLTATLKASLPHARLSIAIKGIVGAPGAATSDWNCSGSCGIVDPGPAPSPDKRHIHTRGGAVPLSQAGIARNGRRANRFQATVNTSYLGRNINGPDEVFRGYINFVGLPTQDCDILVFTASSGAPCRVLYRAATQDLVGVVGTSVTGSAQAIVVGQFYRIDAAASMGTGSRTMKLRVAVGDEASTDLGTATLAVAAGTIGEMRWGASGTLAVTADVVWQDLRTSNNPSSYPLGAGQGIGLQFIGDSVHGYNANGDFKYDDTTNVPVDPESLAWSYLVGLLNSGLSWLSAPNAAAAEFLEFALGGMVPATLVNCVEVVALLRGANTTAHAATFQMKDGATVVDLYTGSGFPSVTPMSFSRHYLTKPTGGAFTQSVLNALLFRFVKVSGNPGIAGVMVEVDFTATAGAGSSESTLQNPSHTYESAGTYNVTKTSVDNHGLSHAVTKPVTVA